MPEIHCDDCGGHHEFKEMLTAAMASQGHNVSVFEGHRVLGPTDPWPGSMETFMALVELNARIVILGVSSHRSGRELSFSASTLVKKPLTDWNETRARYFRLVDKANSRI